MRKARRISMEEFERIKKNTELAIMHLNAAYGGIRFTIGSFACKTIFSYKNFLAKRLRDTLKEIEKERIIK